MSEKRIDYHGRLDARTELGDGSVRFIARLTRTGVFDYGDHKELRVADEVFKKEALESFKGLAVTDGHAAWIDSDNWRTHAVGHVGDDVHQDGDFVVASLIVKDRDMLAKIDSGERVELSMGYAVDLERTPGRTEDGQEYDAVQRNIRGNHAALGPANWGRAGTSVRLLDGATYACGDMSEKKIDAPASEKKDDAAEKLDAANKRADEAEAKAVEAAKRADTLEAERDAARKDADAAKASLDEQKKSEADRVDARVTLVLAAKKLAPELDPAGKSDREIRETVLKHVDASSSYEGKSDDYVSAAFDIATKQVASEKKNLAEVHTPAPAPVKSKLDEAHEKAEAELRALNQAGPPPGAYVKK